MERKMNRRLGSPLALALVLALLFGSLVMAGPEVDQQGTSWPHEVLVTPNGPTAMARLRQIHDQAISALPDASPEDRDAIVRVLKASFECAAYDGIAVVADPNAPPPKHAQHHTDAAAEVQAAYEALHRPPTPPEHPEEWADWSLCADHLEHGHD